MKIYKLDSMTKGWFVGDFESAFRTKDCEVAVKKYKAGDFEAKHLHKIATEVTAILSGSVLMNDKEYGEGDIIVMEPGEATDFKAITDVVNVVVKVPSVVGDKYATD
ncbi:MAG: hypothetical protein AABX65_03300 [Nanoarchaeota archaeon]